MEHEKWCKHCESHHPSTNEYWEFRSGKPYRCKAYRKQKYHGDGGKERAQKYWREMSFEKKMEILEKKRLRYQASKTRKKVDK